MSYARFGAGGSDVYVFLHYDRCLQCCGCILQEREWVEDPDYLLTGGYFKRVGEHVETRFTSTADLLAHLDRHRAAGHCVDEGTYEGLKEDAAANDYWIATGDDSVLT